MMQSAPRPSSQTMRNLSKAALSPSASHPTTHRAYNHTTHHKSPCDPDGRRRGRYEFCKHQSEAMRRVSVKSQQDPQKMGPGTALRYANTTPYNRLHPSHPCSHASFPPSGILVCWFSFPTPAMMHHDSFGGRTSSAVAVGAVRDGKTSAEGGRGGKGAKNKWKPERPSTTTHQRPQHHPTGAEEPVISALSQSTLPVHQVLVMTSAHPLALYSTLLNHRRHLLHCAPFPINLVLSSSCSWVPAFALSFVFQPSHHTISGLLLPILRSYLATHPQSWSRISLLPARIPPSS